MMARSRGKFVECGPATRAERLRKARGFLALADDLLVAATIEEDGDRNDAYVSLCVLAGIAASDAICCARTGTHPPGDDHGDAITILSKENPSLGRHLGTLLQMKTRAAYSELPSTAPDMKKAGRGALALVEYASSIA